MKGCTTAWMWEWRAVWAPTLEKKAFVPVVDDKKPDDGPAATISLQPLPWNRIMKRKNLALWTGGSSLTLSPPLPDPAPPLATVAQNSPIVHCWSNDLSILHAEFNPTIYFIELLYDQTGYKQGTLSLLTWYTSLAAKASERVRNVGKDAFAWYWLPSASVVIVEPLIHHFTVKRPFDQCWQGRLHYQMRSWFTKIRSSLTPTKSPDLTHPHFQKTNWITCHCQISS